MCCRIIHPSTFTPEYFLPEIRIRVESSSASSYRKHWIAVPGDLIFLVRPSLAFHWERVLRQCGDRGGKSTARQLHDSSGIYIFFIISRLCGKRGEDAERADGACRSKKAEEKIIDGWRIRSRSEVKPLMLPTPVVDFTVTLGIRSS